MLGGHPRLRQVNGILDTLSSSDHVSRKVRCAKGDVLDLLTLRHVADDDRPEAGYFARLDPSQPSVAENCLLAEP